MRNIISIIKYDFKSQKTQIIIQMGILIFLVLQSFWGNSWFPAEFKFIPIVSIFLLINLIVSIVKYIRGITTDEGRLLFMAPIKGWEYVLSKYIEYIVASVIIALIALIGVILGDGSSQLYIISSVGMIFGFTGILILITSFATIYNSHFNKKSVSVILTIVSLVLYGLVVSILQIAGLFVFPRVYMIVGNFFEINIFESIIEILSICILVYLNIYHIDKKLDII